MNPALMASITAANMASIAANRKRHLNKCLRKKYLQNKGEFNMYTEMLNELISKTVIIYLFGDVSSVAGVITKIENNWLKIDTKKGVQYINIDMITDIIVK